MGILITGATGFVGGAVARALLDAGESVHLLLRPGANTEAWSSLGANVFTGSIADPAEVHRAAAGCECVVHCAGIGNSRSSTRALGWVNVAGTENVLNAASHAGCGRMIHLSCANVTLYNGDRVTWTAKDQPPHEPIGAHAKTKLLGEAIVLSHLGKMDTAAIRPRMVWGIGDSSRLPELCREMLGGGIRLVGSGDTLMATVHISNLIRAVLGAIDAADVRGHAFYVNDPEMHTSGDFFGQLSTALGGPAPRRGLSFGLSYTAAKFRARFGGRGLSPEDVLERGRSSYFDHQAAVEAIGYAPQPSSADGMAALATWAQEQGGIEAIAARAHPPATDDDVRRQITQAAPG